MADKYISIDGSSGNGGTSWASDPWDIATWFSSATAGDIGHFKHPTLNGDGSGSGSTYYSIPDRYTMTNAGTSTAPIITLAYDSSDVLVQDFDAACKIDMSGSSNSQAVVASAYNWFHGFEWQNAYLTVLYSASSALMATLNYFHDNPGSAIYNSGSYGRSFLNKQVNGSVGQAIYLGNYGVAMLNAVDLYQSFGIRAGGYGVVGFNYSSNPGGTAVAVSVGTHGVAICNSGYADKTAGVINGIHFESNQFPVSLLNILEGFDAGLANNISIMDLFNVFYDCTLDYEAGKTPLVAIGKKTADPQFIDAVNGNLSIGNTDYIGFGPGPQANNIGAWQGGAGGGAGSIFGSLIEV